MKICLLQLLASLVFFSPALAATDSCESHAKVLKELSASDSDSFTTWLSQQKSEDLSELAPSAKQLKSIWKADINHDGKDEWVVADSQGSGGYLVLFIFEQNGSGFKLLPGIPWPMGERERDGGWSSHAAENFIVQICNQNYLVMQGDKAGVLEGYLWKDGKNKHACGDGFSRYLLTPFNRLYENKDYKMALNLLDMQFKLCSSQMGSELRMNYESNVSVAAFHAKDKTACLKWVDQAKKEKGFETSKFKKSVLHNEALCK